MNYKINLQTDTEGGGYEQWWEVTDDLRTFRSDGREDAEWLCELLNRQEPEKPPTDLSSIKDVPSHQLKLALQSLSLSEEQREDISQELYRRWLRENV